MSLRPILLHPDPRLKKVADPVGEISDEMRRLADDMLETMYDAPGVGLAAPQVGVSKRLLVMDCIKEDDVPPRPMVLDDSEQSERFDGLWATCVQHEIDHLNGKLFIGHLTGLKRQLITRKAVKRKRELARAS